MTLASVVAAISAALITAVMLCIMRRLLPSSFMASQVRVHTGSIRQVAQIGGIAIMVALVTTMLAARWSNTAAAHETLSIIISIVAIWALGMYDDLRHPGALPKLIVQLIVAGSLVAALHRADLPTPMLLLVMVVLAWFMNMVNFMDGMDMMGPAGLGVPLAFSGALLLMQEPGNMFGVLALVAAGALAGFLPFNLPPARLYLGDNGSLVLGLVSGLVALELWFTFNPAAALLPFGYYLTDTVSTLLRRVLAGENILRAHTSHAFQMARKNGRSEFWVMAHIVPTGVALGGLALVAAHGSVPLAATALGVGLILCGMLILRLRGKF
ncbi:MAG: hypothetical protein R3D32_11025 [Nitratireductor sp.]